MAGEVKTVPSTARQNGYIYVPVPGNPGLYFEVAQTNIGKEIADPVTAGRLFKRRKLDLIRPSVDLSVSLLGP